MSRYQLLPPLRPEVYDALYDDIKAAGVRVPIDVDEQGNILDGHHRKQIADELGIECPERVVRGLEEFAKDDYALTVNLTRRHLDNAEKKIVVTNSLKRAPKLSDREHARRCGVSHPFVAGLREALEESGQLEAVTSRVGKDSRERPLPTPAPAPEAAAADRVGPAVASPDGSAPAPGPAETSTAGATGSGSAPDPVADTSDHPGAPASETVPGEARTPDAPEQGGPATSPAGPPCEKCGGEILPGQANQGYTRCDYCDPEGCHVRLPDVDGCRGCRVLDETDPAYLGLSIGEGEFGLFLECGECDGLVAHLKPGGSLPEILAAAREHTNTCP